MACVDSTSPTIKVLPTGLQMHLRQPEYRLYQTNGFFHLFFSCLHAFSSSQFLMSPVYPKYYVGGRRCKWTLRSDPGQRIQLRFLDISLREEVSQSSHPQCADSIRVTERGRNLLSMCGESKQDIVLLSDANKLEASLL